MNQIGFETGQWRLHLGFAFEGQPLCSKKGGPKSEALVAGRGCGVGASLVKGEVRNYWYDPGTEDKRQWQLS